MRYWLVTLAFIAGCETAPDSPEAIALHSSKCAQYGFVSGTPEMAQCIQYEVQAQRQAGAQRRANAAALSQAIMAQQPPPPQITTTNCRRFGNTVNCTTF